MNEEEHNCDNVNCNHNNTKGLCCLFNPENCKYRQLQKENAELKKENQKWKDGIALKDEEIGCIETDFNTFKSKAKEIIGELFHYIPYWTGKENDKSRVYAMPDELRAKAEQFLSELEAFTIGVLGVLLKLKAHLNKE